MDNVLNARFKIFCDNNNRDPSNPKSFTDFIDYLNSKEEIEPPALNEDEAFSIYSQYCYIKKRLRTSDEIGKIADRKYQREYNKKNFKSLASRKSKLFILNKSFSLSMENLILSVFADSTDHGAIITRFIAVEEYGTSLGKCYKMTTKSFDDAIIFTGHFIDRYAERNGMAKNREDNISTFLNHLVTKRTFTIGKTKTGHCSLPLLTGLALGYNIKNIFIFKTFVDSTILRDDQIMDAMVLKAKELTHHLELGNLC